MKILIISRSIYPSSFPRAIRATELAKEFARQGHDVTLYGELGQFNYTCYENKNCLKIKNIGKLLFSTCTSDGISNTNIISKVLTKLFKRIIEFPDIELMFKMPKIIKLEKNVDLLISIALPYPIHWGCALAKSLNRNTFPKLWVADCGDPYMGNMVKTKPPFFYFKYIEKWFCRQTDYIAVPVVEALNAYYSEFRKKIVVIPQGVVFPDIKENHNTSPNVIPTFAYAGSFYKGFRDPSSFLEYLVTIRINFKCILYTDANDILTPFKDKLGQKLEIRKPVPREELLKLLCRMDFLLNFENGTSIQSPSKLIDYLVVNKPILSIPNRELPIQIINEFINHDYRNRLVINNPEQYRVETVVRSFLNLIYKNTTF